MKHVFHLSAYVTLALAGCGTDPPSFSNSNNSDDGWTALYDPLGIELVSVGLGPGSLPCGTAEQVAAVVDTEGRYVAFCRNDVNDISLFQSGPTTVQPLPLLESALETFVSLTPSDIAVPEVLVGDHQWSLIVDRELTDEKVAYVDPVRLIQNTLGDACSDPTYFATEFRDKIITPWIRANPYDKLSQWLELHPHENMYRTHTARTLITKQAQGRNVVYACGDSPYTIAFEGHAQGALSLQWSRIFRYQLMTHWWADRVLKNTDLMESARPARDIKFYTYSVDEQWFREAGAIMQKTVITDF